MTSIKNKLSQLKNYETEYLTALQKEKSELNHESEANNRSVSKLILIKQVEPLCPCFYIQQRSLRSNRTANSSKYYKIAKAIVPSVEALFWNKLMC